MSWGGAGQGCKRVGVARGGTGCTVRCCCAEKLQSPGRQSCCGKEGRCWCSQRCTPKHALGMLQRAQRPALRLHHHPHRQLPTTHVSTTAYADNCPPQRVVMDHAACGHLSWAQGTTRLSPCCAPLASQPGSLDCHHKHAHWCSHKPAMVRPCASKGQGLSHPPAPNAQDPTLAPKPTLRVHIVVVLDCGFLGYFNDFDLLGRGLDPCG